MPACTNEVFILKQLIRETNTAVCQIAIQHITFFGRYYTVFCLRKMLHQRAENNCHPGAQMNFAMSGANHLNLKIDEEPLKI